MSLRQTLSMIAAGTLGAPAALAQSSVAPRVGEPAPLFQGVLADGDPVALQDLRGRTVVLYFYPKDDTPGCTIEAKGFRDLAPAFEAAGAVVLGVSRDSPESHRKFRKKHDLNFGLISDPEGRIHDAYRAFKEGSVFGRTALGVDRSTFVIGPDGILLREWRSVDPSGHAEEVLRFVQGIRTGSR